MFERNDNIESVQKTLKLIELMTVNNGDLSVTQISKALSCSVSSANRFLITLKNSGYIEKNPYTNRYELSFRLYSLGARLVENSYTVKKLIDIGHIVAQKFNVSVHINSMFGMNAILLFRITKFYNKDLEFICGQSAPAYCTSSGKALLSLLPQEKIDEYINNTSFISYQPNTINKEQLKEELILAAKNGYAVCNEEYVSGIFSFTLPITDSSDKNYAFTLILPTKDKKRVFNAETINYIKNLLDSIK